VARADIRFTRVIDAGGFDGLIQPIKYIPWSTLVTRSTDVALSALADPIFTDSVP
jgi:hypothetical protein